MSDNLDTPIWGPEKIAKEFNRKVDECYFRAKSLPVKKVGKHFVTSRRRILNWLNSDEPTRRKAGSRSLPRRQPTRWRDERRNLSRV
jgi:hypothetical protein